MGCGSWGARKGLHSWDFSNTAARSGAGGFDRSWLEGLMVPTYGIVWCCFTVKGHRLWDGLLGGSANEPQIWDKCPGWVGVMPPKVTIYGSTACQEHERTPDMGHRAGMVRPDSPQRSPSMGVPRAKSMKGPQIWDTEPGWYGLIPPKGHHLWDARPTGLRPAACWPLLGWGLPPRPPWRWTPPPPAPSRRLPHPACHQGNRTLRGPAVLVVFQDGG